MIRKIMRLGDYRAGIARWDLEQTPEAMEMGFSDVVQPCYIMERDVFQEIIASHHALGPNTAAEWIFVTVPLGVRWIVHRISLWNTDLDARVLRVDMRWLGNSLILALPGVARWVSGDMSLPVPGGAFILVHFSSGLKAGSTLHGCIYCTREVVR